MNKAQEFGEKMAGFGDLKPEPLIGAAVGGALGLGGAHLAQDKEKKPQWWKYLAGGLGGAAAGMGAGAAYPAMKDNFAAAQNKARISAQIQAKMKTLIEPGHGYGG